MPVASDEEVKAITKTKLPKPGGLESAGEVRHHNLPVCGGRLQPPLHPPLLLVPEVFEPPVALILARWTSGARAARTGRIVGATDVVLGVEIAQLRIHRVRVEHEEFCAEAQVRVMHELAPIDSWHHPPRIVPRVCNLLVPGVIELPATPVMVAQDTQPFLPVQPRTMVNTIKDGSELVECHLRDLIHWGAAIHPDTSLIE
mmetsp:Transcript_97632/g.285012  ORF Transcript_97632/g.285012 Transcript_97632/m.285012 type:complete len:201 (-) Transcript_97632:323-925(-)